MKFKHIKLPKKKYILPFVSAAIIIGGTYLAIQVGKGYRPTKDGLTGTGLLAANSFPPGAEVYLNDRLTTATDDTINLPPGTYEVSIKKDGYSPWKKTIAIQEELVSQTNAELFRAVPNLSPLTLQGATNIVPSPNGQKIAFAVASASAQAKNGLYVLELTSSALPLQQSPKQIARNTPDIDFSQAILLWSPDSSQILAHSENSQPLSSNYLLATDSMNDIPSLPDISVRLPVLLSEWEEDIANRETKQLTLLPDEFQRLATSSAITNIYFSPSEEKIFYTGKEYFTLADNLIDTPPSTSSQQEVRNIEPGGLYVYDLIEDKNFQIGSIDIDSLPFQKDLLVLSSYQQSNLSDATQSAKTTIASQNPLDQTNNISIIFNRLQQASFSETANQFKAHYSSIYLLNYQWLPNSTHLLIHNQSTIDVIEYDATNRVTLYSGPFQDNFVYPWPNGSKLIIVTNLNPDSALPENLYSIDIK